MGVPPSRTRGNPRVAGVLMLSVFHLVNLFLFQGGIDWAFVWNPNQTFRGAGMLLSLLGLIRRRAPSISPVQADLEGAMTNRSEPQEKKRPGLQYRKPDP